MSTIKDPEVIATINVTPTWTSLIPGMIAVLQNPKASAESHAAIAEELTRLARLGDIAIEHQPTCLEFKQLLAQRNVGR